MANVDVYLGKPTPVFAGFLQASRDHHVFTYGDAAHEALSLTMPVRRESYTHTALHPLFQMNLPEGALRDALERMTAKRYGSDDLTLLTLLGRNQIGRLAYAPAGQAMLNQQGEPLTLDYLLHHEDKALFADLLSRYATSSGVAGVQPKVLLDVAGRLTLPIEHYIVKSWTDAYPHLACNEWVCMSIARAAGLVTPNFYLNDNAQLFISRRFDIQATGEVWGFEDFCVLQAKTTRQKYDSSLEACTHTIRQFVSPAQQAAALADFYKLTVLNVRIRNGDAHLKNYGILYPDLQHYQPGAFPMQERILAPVFDLVSTVPYLPNDTMALLLNGSKRWPKPKILLGFGKQQCGLSPAQIEDIHADVEQALVATLPELERLANTFVAFRPIAETMASLWRQALL